MAASKGGEAGATARERLGAAQASPAEAGAAQLRGETVALAEVETFRRRKLRGLPKPRVGRPEPRERPELSRRATHPDEASLYYRLI
jgi:hypothetical protein